MKLKQGMEWLQEYEYEFIFLLTISTVIYYICGKIRDKLLYNNTIKYTHTTFQSTTKFFDFHIKNENLAKNNAIYLTTFNHDGYTAILLHIGLGYLLYFKDPINSFCLLISVGQIYEYKDFRSLIPLFIFATISMATYVYSMTILLRQQKTTNMTKITRMNNKKQSKKIKQKSLKRGDFIELSSEQDIPADILILNHKQCAVQELELTGEDIVINKSGLPFNINTIDDNTKITINHKNNDGFIISDQNHFNYNSKNMIFRGTKIVDGTIFGIVIETGNDCQIYNINNNIQKSKTEIQKKIIDICMMNLYLLLVMASVTSIILYSKTANTSRAYKKLWLHIRQMILLFNTMIPLSLQFFFTISSQILSHRISKSNKVTINRNGIMAFQVNPDYIVSDKTGTITTNELEISNIYVNSVDIMEKKEIDKHMTINFIACSETQIHSKTNELLKNDIIEEKLITHILNKTKQKLTINQIPNNENSGLIKIDDLEYQRIYYKPYDYNLEVKLAVIKGKNELILHIQGTPEAVNKYSSNQLNDILRKIEIQKTPTNIYKRVIAYANKHISNQEYELLKHNPQQILTKMEHSSCYVFNDFIVKNMDLAIEEIRKNGLDFTMLTGDKQSSAVEIGKSIGIISNDYLSIETIDDIDKVNKCKCIVLNGRLLEELICSNKISGLINIIEASKQRIIFRSTPNGKQLFVSFLQKYMRKEVMMIGDGSNDVAAIIQSNIGIGIKKDNNLNVQNISEITINNWTIIPTLLNDFKGKRLLINNIAGWVLMKHMISAIMSGMILLLSKFETIKDPASPLLMICLNSSMFLCTVIFSYVEEITYNVKSEDYHHFYKSMLIKGIVLGIINGLLVLTQIDINNGIYLLICAQVIELLLQNYYLSQKSSIIKITHVCVALVWIIATNILINISMVKFIGVILVVAIIGQQISKQNENKNKND